MSSTVSANRYEDLLGELACEFAANYVGVSVDENEYKRYVKRVLSEDIAKTVGPRRNIVVLGAGATHGTHRDIPLAMAAINRIEKELGIKQIADDAKNHTLENLQRQNFTLDNGIKLKYKEELRRIASHEQEKTPTFETSLAILSNFFSLGTLQEHLVNIYGKDLHFNPSFTYEIIAHLFAHRFIDVIINFNFDELLDAAVVEEIGGGNYRRIISDSDCHPLQDLLIAGRLKMPIYIKPHGTVSDQHSLRFTRDDYFRVPFSIQELLRSLLSGRIGMEEEDKDPIPVNVVTIGFGMQSVEFNHLLKDYLPKESRIYHIDLVDPFKSPKTPVEQYLKSLSRVQSEDSEDPRLITIDDNHSEDRSLDATLVRLWERIWDCFPKEQYKPRALWRHRLTSALFQRPYDKQEQDDNNRRLPQGKKSYLLARCYAELAMALARGKGRVSLIDLLSGRFGHYYDHYCKVEKGDRTFEEIFSRFKISELESLGGYILTHTLAKDVLSSSQQWTAELAGCLAQQLAQALIDDPEIPDYRQLDCVTKRSGDTLPEASLLDFFQKRIEDQPVFVKKYDIKTVQGLLHRLATHDSATVRPQYNSSELYLFTGQSGVRADLQDWILHTHLAYTCRFEDAWESDWDWLLIVSERGKSLARVLKDLDTTKKRMIHVIRADGPHVYDFPRYDTHTLSIRERTLPQYLHRHHMAVFLKYEDKRVDQAEDGEILKELGRQGWKILESFHFRRANLSSSINPIRLLDNPKENHASLLEFFFTYLLQSEVYKKAEKLEKVSPKDQIPLDELQGALSPNTQRIKEKMRGVIKEVLDYCQ